LAHRAADSDQIAPLSLRRAGLMLPVARKSVEPMTARLAGGTSLAVPLRVRAAYRTGPVMTTLATAM
jgi:hypothetical protein